MNTNENNNQNNINDTDSRNLQEDSLEPVSESVSESVSDNASEAVSDNDLSDGSEDASTSVSPENTAEESDSESNSDGESNIDEILMILEKRKKEALENGDYEDNCPTRIDTDAVSSTSDSGVSDKTASSSSDKNEGAVVSFSIGGAMPVDSNTNGAVSEKGKVGEDNIAEKNKATNGSRTETTVKKPLDKQKTADENRTSNPAPKNNTSKTGSQSGGISLDDFTDNKPQNKSTKKKKCKFLLPGFVKMIIYLLVVFGISIGISIFIISVGKDVFAFGKQDKQIEVTIPEDASLKQVAQILHDNGVIEHPLIFRIYCDNKIKKSTYYTGEYLAGPQSVNSAMNFEQLLGALSVTETRGVVRVTIPEGYTLTEIADLFVEKGVFDSKKREDFIKYTDEYEADFEFLKELDEKRLPTLKDEDGSTKRSFRLEGYLYPDTYDFYVDESFESILDKLVGNFDKKFDSSFYNRCEELGLTVDEVITLASIIEGEGDSASTFSKISSVFHNRLNDTTGSFKKLDADATTLYALNIDGIERKVLIEGDINYDSPYNTRVSSGIPPGPICCPGYEAIYAALYPYEPIDAKPGVKEYLEDVNYNERTDVDFYYFITMPDRTTRFAGKTSEEVNKFNGWVAELRAAS